MSLAFRGVRTRQPFPWRDEARHRLVGLAYRLASDALAHRFRHSVDLTALANARILILKPCCLGDVVFSTALVRELRRALTGARITYATGRHSRPAIEGNPHLDAILDTGRVGSGAYSAREYLDLVGRLRAGLFDCCFVLERSAILALAPLLAGVPVRVGIDSGGRGFSLNVAVSTRPTRPESELYLDLLRAIGGQPESGDLEYRPPAEAARRVAQLISESGLGARPFAVLHAAGGTNPGMALLRKRWPADSFRQLAGRILENGADVVLVGAIEDREIASQVVAKIHDDRPPTSAVPPSPSPMERGPGGEARVVDLVGQLSLGEVAALARRAAVYVGNDSGPTHLAEAAGANVVMLFGPSDPIVYGPRSRRATAISSGFWCSPCFVDGRVAPCANVICMEAIPVERVWRSVAPFLAGAAAR